MSQAVAEGKPSRWVLTALTLTHVAQHFYYAGVPILFQGIKADLILSYTDLGIMTGAANIIGGFLQFAYSIAARLLPKRVLLGCADLAIGLGCLVMGLADRFAGLLLGNVVAGVGQAGQHPVGTSIIAQKFGREKVARAMSIFYGLGYVGNIVSPILLSTIAVFVGWRGSFFFLALIPLATGLNVLFYLRREPSGDKTPETSGGDFKGDVRSVMKIKGTAFVIAAQSFIVGGTGLGVLITWMPQFLQDPAKGLGLSMGEAGLIVSIATVGGVVGTVAIGRVADQIGHLRTAMMCLVSTIVTVYLLAHYQTLTPILAPHLFIIGVTTFPIPTLLQSHLTTISTVSQRDILLGLYFTFGYGFSTLWSTIIGRIIDGFSFSAAWTLMSTLGLFALLMLFVAFRCQRM